MVKVWHAREVVVKVDASTSITTAAALDTFFSGTAIEGSLKDMTLKWPSADTDKIDLHGDDANGFQNAEKERKPFGMAELSGTLVFPGDEVVETLFFPTGTAINGTHTRYRPGTGTEKHPSFLINLDDGTDEVNFAMESTDVMIDEIKSTGADGSFEFTFTAKALPRNCFGPEFKD